jgi:xanthine dehydrogenase small subunit
MRDYILLYLNGKRYEVRGEQTFMTLADFLRYEKGLTGTKIVCAEGDCGACSVLRGEVLPNSPELRYSTINACITFVQLMDCTHVITVEGLQEDQALSPVQTAMVENYGAQCGFCTPGFVCAMTDLVNHNAYQNPKGQTHLDEKQIRNGLTGNLCRCTGYTPIIDAGKAVDLTQFTPLQKRYDTPEIVAELHQHKEIPIQIQTANKHFYAPTTLQAAVEFKHNQDARIFASATDMGVQINKDRSNPTVICSLNLVPEAHELSESQGLISVGARVTLNELEHFMRGHIPEFARLLKIFASPQIKNKGTLVGNVANASPIADTLPFLLVADAEVELIGLQGTRKVNINRFYTGYKQLDMKADELISRILIPIPDAADTLRLFKVSNRKDLDISTFTAGFRLRIEADKITRIAIAYGGVAATVLRLPKTEAYLLGKPFSLETFQAAGTIARSEISPISDVRASAAYRLQIAENILLKLYHELAPVEV